MRWEAFCLKLHRRFGPPELIPLDPAPENPAELAEAAKKLLQDPVFRLAMDRLQERLVDQWRHSALGSKSEREVTYLLHSAIAELRAELVRMTTVARRQE